MHIIYIIINSLSILVVFLFFLFLLGRRKESQSARRLFDFIFFAFIWLSLELLGSLKALSDDKSLFFWRATFVVVYISVILMLRLVLSITKQHVRKWARILFYVYVFIISLTTILTDKIILRIDAESYGWSKEYLTGDWFLLAGIAIMIPAIASVSFAIRKYIKSKEKSERIQLKYVTAGMAIPVVIGSITNLALPALSIKFPKLLAPSVVMMVFFFIYSIYQSDAFSIRMNRFVIKTKIFVTFFITGITLTMVGMGVSYQASQVKIRQEADSHLQTVAKSRFNHVEDMLLEYADDIKILSHDSDLIEALQVFPGDDEYQKEFAKMVEKSNDFVSVYKKYSLVSVYDKNKKLIFSTDSQGYLFNDKIDEYFALSAKETKTWELGECPVHKTPGVIITAPVYDDNDFLGLVLLDVNLERLFNVLTDSTGLGETGEVYLIDRDRHIISPLRGLSSSASSYQVNSEVAEHCFDRSVYIGSHNYAQVYKDYRGVDVLGTHLYMPGNDWCLLAEIDKEEALGSLMQPLLVNSFVALVIILIIYIIANWLGRIISEPINKLRAGMEIIEKGDLTHRVGTDDQDEIGELSRAFDKMTTAIVSSRKEIDRKVKEQTEEIVEKQKLLTDQQKAVLNVLEDVEYEKEQTAREKEKIDAILHSIGDGVFAINNDSRITMFNEVAENITGYKAKEAEGKKFDEVIKLVNEKDGKANNDFIKKVITTGEPREMPKNLELIRKNKEKIAVADSASPLKDKNGETRGCVVVFRDVEKERAIDKAKTEFVSLASHQLRTPLTSINWYTEMLLTGDAGKITKEQEQYLMEVYKGNKRMVTLVNSLLNVSRLELGTFTIEPETVNIIELADQEIKALKPQTKKKKIEIKSKYSAGLEKYIADPRLLAMVFQNLLSNAVKYTPAGGNVSLNITKRKHDIFITIKDTGYGIPKRQHKNIFTKLFRADNVRQMDTEGTGLGLYIIKEIVDQVGGRIYFESEEKKGTTFYVSLPIEGMKKKKGSKTLD